MPIKRDAAKIVVFAVAAFAVLQAAAGKDHHVGGTTNWGSAPVADFYNTWSNSETFNLGDNLVFKYYIGAHNVQVVSASEYAGCWSSTAKLYSSGSDVIPLLEARDYFFICSFVDLCEQGMKMRLTMTLPPDHTLATPSDAPTPVSDTPPSVSDAQSEYSNSSPIHSQPPSSVYARQSPPPPPTPASTTTPPPLSDPLPPPSPTPAPTTTPLPPSDPTRAPPPSLFLGPLPAPLTPPAPAPVGSAPVASKSKAVLIAGVCVGVFTAVLVALLILVYYFRLRNSQKVCSVKPDFRPYTFTEIKSMTRNFNQSELLSSGAFGDVYRGGSLFAVKRIKHGIEEGEASFVAEANSLRQLRHRNLLQLRGWCEVKQGLFLVYDFMSNGSLDKWLHPKLARNPSHVTVPCENLSWNVRYSILSGVASALEYLHQGWTHCVLHRDVKSSNVLLDADFNPYLGDFGPTRLVDHHKLDKTTTPAGTFGYMAPEIHYSGKATKETDVYAFGVLVLEVVCGSRPFVIPSQDDQHDESAQCLLVDRVWRAHEAGNIVRMVDANLWESHSEISSSHELMASSLQWGLFCCLPNPSERPSMRLVNHWFQTRGVRDFESVSLPATQPAPPNWQRDIASLLQQSGESTSDQSASVQILESENFTTAR